ncbi:MAG: DUF4445 domain-containing protein [Proteobacteria bacterium]|nr:DUF4445 domain-containing protein [Pseudomonadota bacterium]MBU1686103.1 DUF4445 domain-containing protein [Pseudomonadota bacterium]
MLFVLRNSNPAREYRKKIWGGRKKSSTIRLFNPGESWSSSGFDDGVPLSHSPGYSLRTYPYPPIYSKGNLVNNDFAHSATSLTRWLKIRATPPSLQDNTADLDRLRRAVVEVVGNRPLLIPFNRTAKVALRFRRAGFTGFAVINDLGTTFELVDFVGGNAPVRVGVALDLGTTHLEATLIDLGDGRQLAHANRENGQIPFGADVLSRVHRADEPGGAAVLHQEVILSINGLIATLAKDGGISAGEIRALSVSGNPVMTHFLLALETAQLIREPYIPSANLIDPCHGADLGLVIHPSAPVWIMPGVGSYFGGDLISGIIASGLHQEEQVCMLIDVGTNAEVVVGCRDWLIACAGAAGPALEGGVARMGMRAGAGAIEHVEIEPGSGEISYTTIHSEKPRGICGSGIIDLVAALYLARIIDIRGKFRPACGHPRLLSTGEDLAFMVATPEEAADGRPVLFGQIDLDAVMRSKAAMYSILTTLVNQVGVAFGDLHKIYVAGAFGRHISPRQAIVLGMLPDLPLTTFVPVGNSSLAGAERALLDRGARDACRSIIRQITYLELNVNQEFMIRFSGSRFIPHTDHTLFPSVPFYNQD